MSFNFLPFKIKFIKIKNNNSFSKHYDNPKLGDKFDGVIDFEETGGRNSKFISLYSDCPRFCSMLPSEIGNNIHHTKYVYSFYTLFFDMDEYSKRTVELVNTKEKVFNCAKRMLNKYGYDILELSKSNFEDIEL